ncbi:MAG: hypothetical protein M3305_17665, partial [Actinomycetota bacterium]|nr:hypothetical protein [Actinomycetota bacterium]
ERTLMFSCFNKNKCLASLKGYEKYIYHYGNQPDEVFDLSEDPLEEHNLAEELGEERLKKHREALLTWRSKVEAEHGRHKVRPRRGLVRRLLTGALRT